MPSAKIFLFSIKTSSSNSTKCQKIELKNELLDAQSSGRTGKLQLLGKLNDASQGASIDFYEGKVVKLRVGSETGQAAAEILTTMSIDRVIFMKSSAIDSSPEANTPDTDALLTMNANLGKVISNDKIIETTIEALSQIMGPNSGNIIDSIAAKYPPAENEKLFLNKCKEATADLVGASMADSIFDRLLDKNS